jgi:AmmeMemoRadiSam system protein B
MRRVRAPAAAGVLYPADASELRLVVGDLLAKVPVPRADAPHPKALIVPHGGLRHSGGLAARAFANVAANTTRVVIAGPAHRLSFEGIALPEAATFVTPLGPVPVDEAATAALLAIPGVHRAELPHRREHAVEMQLPFLQVLLERFAVVPLLVGGAAPDLVAAALRTVWGGPETLIVVTTDLSQHRAYVDAQRIDRTTADRITRCEPGLGGDCACGATIVDGLLAVASERGLEARTLGLANSGDTGADTARVVGYGAFGFY